MLEISALMGSYISTACHAGDALLDGTELRYESLSSRRIDLHLFLCLTHVFDPKCVVEVRDSGDKVVS